MDGHIQSVGVHNLCFSFLHLGDINHVTFVTAAGSLGGQFKSDNHSISNGAASFLKYFSEPSKNRVGPTQRRLGLAALMGHESSMWRRCHQLRCLRSGDVENPNLEKESRQPPSDVSVRNAS